MLDRMSCCIVPSGIWAATRWKNLSHRRR